MTAVSLFDALALEESRAPSGAGRATRLAATLVEALLADWQRIRQLQEEFAPGNWDNPPAATAVEASIYELHETWTAEAEEVLDRLRKLSLAGSHIAGTEALEDAYGLARARLKLTPDKLARTMEQVRRGEFTPAEELRNELRSRLRA